MSRCEFMRQLEELLSDIPPYEREEALQYYNDYFNDAGKENEQEVIRALGSPEQVAEIVRDGLAENGNQGEFTEKGFTNKSDAARNEVIKRTWEAGGMEDAPGSGPKEQDAGTEEKKGMPAWVVVLIVIACILGSPVIFGAAMVILTVIFSVIVAILSIILGVGAATLALYASAIALMIAGFGILISYPYAGIGLLGGGLICAALGILCMLLLVFLVGKCIPGICRGTAYIFKKLFHKKGGAAA